MVLVDLNTGALISDPQDVATVLEPDADTDALAAAAGGNAGPIAISFPRFVDGRGFSLALLLRERHGFKGEIGPSVKSSPIKASTCCAPASTPP